jgi:membrane associated rhomboid family serine protease/Zn-finger nucleic acid-binding protein
MFLCPRCHQQLERRQADGGVHWECPACTGRTSTIARLRHDADPDVVAHLWEQAQSEFAADSLPCPACRCSMKAAWLPAGSGNLQIDVCLRCHMAWFDKSEYERTPGNAGDPQWKNKNIPLAARLAMVKLHVAALDPRPDVEVDTTPPREGWKAVPAFLGLPVKQEDLNPLQQAAATVCLGLAAAAIGLLALYLTPGMLQDFGFIPAQASRLGYASVVTAIFLHGSLPHLATSLYFLLTFGADVEHALGTARFLILVLAAAAGGDLLHALAYPGSTVPLVGLGPAISGLLAAYGLRYPNARIGFILRLPLIVYRWVNLPAWVYILFWMVTQAIGAARETGQVEQVSWAAHLGGVLAGSALGIVLSFARKPGADEASPDS